MLTSNSTTFRSDEQESYLRLKRDLSWREGFGILFVRCTPVQEKRIIEEIQQDINDKTVDVLKLDHSIYNLYDLIEEKVNDNPIDILFVSGIEKSLALDDYIKRTLENPKKAYQKEALASLLGHLNWQRERFRDDFNCCLVFTVRKYTLRYLVRRAPDFFDWRSGVIEFPVDRDIDLLDYYTPFQADIEPQKPQEVSQNIFHSSDEYYDLLKKLLLLEYENNGDLQFIYSVIKSNLSKLDLSFKTILHKWILNTCAELNPEEKEAIAGIVESLCIDISKFPLGKWANAIEIAITGLETILKLRPRETLSQQWAQTIHNLAAVYSNRIFGKKAENIEISIDYYKSALEVRVRDNFPEQWATTINNLAIAYTKRIKDSRRDNLEAAIGYYQQALEVRSREDFPYEWATTQNNLGNAYLERITGEKAQNLEEAIPCFQLALRVYTCQDFPYEWATTQNNLGNAYLERITGEKAQNLEEAIPCFQLALRVYTREAFPIDWARTQNNLGNAYRNRIKGEKAQNLEYAITCFQLALKVYTPQALPYEWATTQNNLGLAYLERITGEKAQNIEYAIACFQSALEVRTREAFPEKWAQTQNNLGLAYSNRITGQKAQNLEYAIACFQSALTVYTFDAFPYEWASTQNNLGNAYRNRIKGEKAQNIEEAIACWQLALKVRTRQAFTREYLQTKNNLAFTYQDVQKFTEAYKAFDATIETVESLREEIISGSGVEEYKTKLAEEWNKVYRGMVEVCIELTDYTQALEYVERSKTRNLVEQILSRDLKSIFPRDVVTKLEQYRDEIAIGQYQIQHGKVENSTALAQHLQELRQQQNDLQDQYLRIGSSFKFEQFQKNLDDKTAIVEFYITGNKLLTFIFTNQTKQPIVLQSQPKCLDKLIRWVNKYFTAYHTKQSHSRRHLTTRLHLLAQILHIDEIIQQIPLECDRLILIPHLYLHLLPLHALPINSKQGGGKSQILMDRFPAGVSYAPSCQLLQLAQTRKRPDFTHLFAVQNPTDDLLYTNIEVEVIKHYFNPAYTDVLAGKAATKTAIDSKPLNTYHCAHFSGHGYFNYEQPRKSALILADTHLSPAPNQLDPEQHLVLDNANAIDLDKSLTLDAVFALKLEQCRLVTLSACETGLIDSNNISDEYIGLPGGFLVAGSPAVVSSLWPVEQFSTALLMIKFYQNLQNQMSLAVALNQAQFWLRDSTQSELLAWSRQLSVDSSLMKSIEDKLDFFHPHEQPFQKPYYWAVFCVIGE
ncbi:MULTISPECIES: CHAT domain-containing protein [unclassified Moorena]|uniref:CHAT domain-containing protein n=1 Tax=unclassified Moorena TaxID=2683338 RepID=UPI00140183AE|nr:MULTISPECIES: CHAT domain-containing protein [unclassified Moorena]NEO14369.1 CHAT domain-containing protein [Moorena sp. SIO3E8]NEQ02941.1 CHAT domain-containing protein [Moorena sp. SIO3F7]